MSGLEDQLASYLAHRMPQARDVIVGNLARIHGGSSQETYRYEASWTEQGTDKGGKFILRRAPEAGLVNAEHDLEYSVYSALDGCNIPIPKAHFLELDPAWLERPFFIMDMAPGKPGDFYGSDDPYDGQSERVGERFWTHLGTLAAIDTNDREVSMLRGKCDPRPVHERELDHWEQRLGEGEDVVEPLLRAAIRWMRRNPPPPPKKLAVVHGDYRSGNFLFTPDGEISAILDWEMCHLGDPLEDIAWALDPFWSMERHFPLEAGLGLWERASGMTIDRDALDWWRLFAAIKCSAIWTTAEKSFEEGTSDELVLALTVLRAGPYHRRVVLDAMEKRGVMG
ncbi:MAG: phosphotransferase family protein [Novosphingobium sp.]|nr:phosphotransferase family protein [Novosphingobium sp.]